MKDAAIESSTSILDWLKVAIPVLAIAVSLLIASAQARRAEWQKRKDRSEVAEAAAGVAASATAQIELNLKQLNFPFNTHMAELAQINNSLSQFTVKELPNAELLLSVRRLEALLTRWMDAVDQHKAKLRESPLPPQQSIADIQMDARVISSEIQAVQTAANRLAVGKWSLLGLR